ncbi:MAG: ferrous iron transport protein A [Aeromonadales bacterium]|nr:ferrous iron transport protein A [Aeromonadales bacterium]
MITLNRVKQGAIVEVVKVNGEGSSLRRRLLDMGITPKTKIKFLRTAPLGDPIEIVVRGYALTLRKEDAMLVEVI